MSSISNCERFLFYLPQLKHKHLYWPSFEMKFSRQAMVFHDIRPAKIKPADSP